MKKITPPFVRSPYNYDPVEACEECCIQEWEPSKTIQSMAEEADINTIVKRFGLTGQLPEGLQPPVYADFDEVMDYKTAQDAIARANSTFMLMPAGLRARFDNNPQVFLEYCSDPDNMDSLREMGLALPKKEHANGEGSGRKPAEGDATGQGNATDGPDRRRTENRPGGTEPMGAPASGNSNKATQNGAGGA